MMDKLFVIAVGGTGMRCLESFVHLCAIGMLDSREVEVLTLDTDQTNGNKGKVEELIRLYNRIKSSDSQEGGTPNADTFFSAKLNLYRFFTNYSGRGRENYKDLVKLSTGSPEQQRDNKLLSDLFLDHASVQEFSLAHGYRAQTHLGSMLIYHGIIEAARNILKGTNVLPQERELEHFISKLELAGESARVFVFGSVFGGTGASAIPVIPKALKDFVSVRSNGASSIDLSKTKFGATLLTEYFTFRKPDEKQKGSKEDSVIADASFFPLNSQAALQFYQSDTTVQRSYKLLYHIGWPVESRHADEGAGVGKTITGGAEQKNACHITELIAACAAYDFFIRQYMPDGQKAEYLYKSAPFRNDTFSFTAEDLFGNQERSAEIFANRLGAMFSLAHISLTANGGAWGDLGIKAFLNLLHKQRLTQYASITDAECADLNDYFKLFAYTYDKDHFVRGWLYQVRNSIAPGNFIFNSKAFADNRTELDRLDVGSVFSDERHHWPKSLISSRYNTFVNKLIDSGPAEQLQKVNTTKEKFLAHLYNALSASQGFKLN
ncbi:hypothetical protein FPZ42_07080 [Mucilaginibacter achroorhodeus]|uniref:Uncharacterized protein n=1 Tax=Mucilaginibacter achroorhodeus TaxID=2599294 RepID=A0A563U652_9SPHI|nr:hypothetical protein [Mucilaginibacter achroorhodeus]TWR26794.1 hypothetical protein FPZ42_07080 [Mucilaginibacter achroorhodeus]